MKREKLLNAYSSDFHYFAELPLEEQGKKY